MFDSFEAFTKQFTPTEGGYLYYPSARDGAKFVTADEYEQLAEGWRKVVGRRGMWTIVGIVMLAIFLWIVISEALSLPDWWGSIIVAASVMGISSWLLWASLAPRRLVRKRPAIAPPRPISEARRQARSLLNWRFIVFALLFSGVIFLGAFNSPERDFKVWAWIIGSGVFFGLYVWIAIQKVMDRQT